MAEADWSIAGADAPRPVLNAEGVDQSFMMIIPRLENLEKKLPTPPPRYVDVYPTRGA